MISINYLVENPFSKKQEINIKNWLEKTIILEGKKPGDINYIVCSDEYLLGINNTFLHHDTYTDIITFPTAIHSCIISGEIYISIDRVIDNATSHHVSFYDEFSRVFIHGILHLLGYNDHEPEEILEMRSKEDYYLNLRP